MEIIPFESKVVAVTDVSGAGEARRLASRLADQMELSETAKGELAIVVTEAARNAAIHGKGGQVLLRPWKDSNENAGVEVMVLDSGPGMADVASSMRDGHSTAGTPGTGLGAISRMSGSFEMYTVASKGTVLYINVSNAHTQHRSMPKLGVVSAAKPGETECGDGWGFVQHGHKTTIMVVDGLGHGAGAREASADAGEIFRKYATAGLERTLRRMHESLRKTRGAAVALAEIDSSSHHVKYSGVGNIQGVIVGDSGVQRLVSHTGTVGFVMGRTQEFTYPWHKSSLLVMHSDGIDTHWDLEKYRGIRSKHPAIAAGVIYRDHRRTRDDSTVLIYTERDA
jgi:anti-sigma regulatory factor (Ser/Thr protein kinase)